MGNAHTKHNQQRRGSSGNVGKDLEKENGALSIARPGHMKEGSHSFKSDPSLEKLRT